jgi:DNA transformation protein
MADSFHDFVRELFAGMGPVQIKRMFGGAGGFRDGLMFLLIADDTIHIKANDDAMKAELREEGSGPFVWSPQNGPRKGEKIDLGYWRLPEPALDDPEEAVRWGRKAFALARVKAKAKPKRTRAVKKPDASPKPKQAKAAKKKKTKR